ncbi:MAG: 7-cyano-7-deazaguanine synthase [Minisyncoccota bacterium]
MLLSGGPDSTSAVYLMKCDDLHLFSVIEKRRTKNFSEIQCAKRIAQNLSLPHTVVDVSQSGELFSDIPEIVVGLGGGNRPGKVVPGFTKQKCVPCDKLEAPLSLAYLHMNAAIFAIAHGMSEIVWAVHADDDIPKGWIASYVNQFNNLLDVFGYDARLLTPFLGISKLELVKRGYETGAPLEDTFSCLHNIDLTHCGQCEGCRERMFVFRKAGIPERSFLPVREQLANVS